MKIEDKNFYTDDNDAIGYHRQAAAYRYEFVDGHYKQITLYRIPEKIDSKEMFMIRRIRSKWQRRIPTFSDTMRHLAKVSNGCWDKVDCICSALMRDRCELNCESYED